MNERVHGTQMWRAVAFSLALALVGADGTLAQGRSGTEGRSDRGRTEQAPAAGDKKEPASDRAKREPQEARTERVPQVHQERAPGRPETSNRSDARGRSEARGSEESNRSASRPGDDATRRGEPDRGRESDAGREPDRGREPERRGELGRGDDSERRNEAERYREPERRGEPDRRIATPHREPAYEPSRPHDRRDRGRVVIRPNVHVSVAWPWQYRYHRHWEPHYRYRQVVYVEVGWGRHRRTIDIDVRTRYHQRVRHANGRYAEVDIYIDAIELYRNGRFMGEVNRIPDELSHIVATVYRDGEVMFDRDVFLVGDPEVGFEMISTRHYDGYVLDRYRDGHGYRVGSLSLRRQRVYMRSYSRLFDPYRFNGYAPISLLPDRGVLADYGEDAISYRYYRDDEYDPYYGGRYEDPYGYEEGGIYYNANPYAGDNPQRPYDARNKYVGGLDAPRVSTASPQTAPFASSSRDEYRTEAGVNVTMRRDIELERIR